MEIHSSVTQALELQALNITLTWLLPLCFLDMIYLCSSGYPGTHCEKSWPQSGDPPAPSSQVLGLETWATTPRPPLCFLSVHLCPIYYWVAPSIILCRWLKMFLFMFMVYSYGQDYQCTLDSVFLFLLSFSVLNI